MFYNTYMYIYKFIYINIYIHLFIWIFIHTQKFHTPVLIGNFRINIDIELTILLWESRTVMG